MSWRVRRCSRCAEPCRCEGVLPFPPGSEVTYGVAWRCDPCDFRSLDVCPVGPLLPRAGDCLNCGSERTGSLCEACGTDAAQIEAMVQAACPDESALTVEALHCASRGLFRLAFHLLDTRLREHPDDTAAWIGKAKLLAAVRLRGRAEALIEEALRHVAPSERDGLRSALGRPEGG